VNTTTDVLTTREGPLGRIRLNRPKALHALTRDMCLAISQALLAWRDDSAVKAVLIDHAPGTRGFCAGGDVVMLARSGAADGADACAFFHAEYRLNELLFSYPKPTLAIMDGITMGGGVGIALPCDYRVATENTKFAMPETGIGLFPDVGGGWYLPRLPGRIGEFMALTGARLDGAECHYLGLATHYVPSENLDALVDRVVAAPSRLAGALSSASVSPPEARIAANETPIHRHFASDRLEDILASLDADGGDWANTEAATIRTKSPLSCKVSLRIMAEGKQRTDFAAEMKAEYALASRVVRTHDFHEGVRALLIDKSGEPGWRPDTPEAVDDAMIDALFAPLPEPWTPFPTAKVPA
jgi:enoyl-CoA hydratase